MARSKPRSVVAVEMLIKQHEVAPVRVFLKFPVPSISGNLMFAAPFPKFSKECRQAFLFDLVNIPIVMP